MILDRITDWIVTAWEFIGLLFLSGGTNPMVLHRWEATANGDNLNGAAPRPPASGGRRIEQPHFA